ncbi:MAG TPA: aspartate kinase, partial [Candidatus Atribacteria bacterium]|nr:aspartate kinase [Candidatus Atribacteria bacterium]
MALIVQKYGGTSVGSIERIKEVAGKIAEKVRGGNKVAIVVSAMGKTTDELLDMAYKINSNPRKRELDMLLATGEQISISLMAMALQELGFSAHAFTGAQAGIITNKIHSRARISKVESDRVKEVLDRGEVAIVAGFQGITEDEDITTLGRGGSDISAVALAAYLRADVCEIYTDVEGVFTADPRIVDNARLIEKISYEEMSEMASLGAKVMHPRSIDYAKRYDVPIKVSSSFTWNEGTLIMKKGEDEMEKVEVVGVTYDKNVAKVIIKGVPDKPGIAYMLFESLAKKEIPIDMIIQSANREGINDIAFTVEEGDLKEAIKIT